MCGCVWVCVGGWVNIKKGVCVFSIVFHRLRGGTHTYTNTCLHHLHIDIHTYTHTHVHAPSQHQVINGEEIVEATEKGIRDDVTTYVCVCVCVDEYMYV